MSTLFITFAVAFVVSLALTPVARKIARRVGAVDHPDGKRKLQEQPVALGGGVAVYIAFGISLLVAAMLREPGQAIPARLTAVLALATGLLALVGFVDDTKGMRPRTKLLLQFLAASPIVIAGFFPTTVSLFGYTWALGWIAAPLTLFWLVACANAMNLLDGLDGFSSTAGITLAIGIAILSAASGNFAVAVAALAIAGALAGFLPYNFPPASIYLGDTGSMLVGLVLGTLSLFAAGIESGTVAVVVPGAIMAIPLWDVLMAIIRRRLTRLPVDAPDREHLHHRLVARGMTNRQSLMLLCALCSTTCLMAAATMFWNLELVTFIAVPCVLLGLAAYRAFGHHEFWLTARASSIPMAKVAAWLHLPREYRPVLLRSSLENISLQLMLYKLEEAATELGLQQVELFTTQEASPTAKPYWKANNNEVPLAESLQFTVRSESQAKSCQLRGTIKLAHAQRPNVMLSAINTLNIYAPAVAQKLAEQPAAIPFPATAKPTIQLHQEEKPTARKVA